MIRGTHFTVLALGAALLLLAGASVHAQGDGPGRRGSFGPRGPGRGVGVGLRQLELTDAQREQTLRPEEFGLQRSPLDAIRITGPTESAALVRSVLAGEAGTARDIVVLNAAAGLMTFDKSLSPTDAAARAKQAIDSGAAAALLRRLVELSHADSPAN